MPPNSRLPREEQGALLAWVQSGAPLSRTLTARTAAPSAPGLWSLKPVVKPELPNTRLDSRSRNPIDRFIFQAQLREGLTPSGEADRLSLIRRVTVDLTGLPPTFDEIRRFLSDREPNAYDRVVDRLLASTAYGERWARHWLDVVRFGESNGYEQNHLRANAWPYRDWVIRSFNEDLPFDEFVRRQLAGDRIAPGDERVEPATGFLVAGIHDTVGNQAEEGARQQRANDLDDIVATTGEAFLGLTVGCARCHDHKFDPIPQADYYNLAAVFAGVRHGERPLGAAKTDRDAERTSVIAAREFRAVAARIADIDMIARERVLRKQGVIPVPRPVIQPRRNVDDFPPVDARFVRFEILATRDGTQPCLDELEVFESPDGANIALSEAGAKATASSALPGYSLHQVRHLNDGRFGNDWSWIAAEAGAGWAQVELPREYRISRVAWGRDGLERPRFTDRLPSRYAIRVSRDGAAWTTVATEAGRAGGTEAIPQADLVAELAPEQVRDRAALSTRLDGLRQRLQADSGVRTAYIGQFAAPDPVFVLKRGDVMQREAEAMPAALSAVGPGTGRLSEEGKSLSGEGDRRLALAAWLTRAENPLTARVIVNRLWRHHFGTGLVSTPSDFGRNGDRPSHPELLDWLAATLAAPEASGGLGWKLKSLHRLIVTSHTYRQSSTDDAARSAKDAGNRYLWRMPLRRMEAEVIRDAVLQASGKLDRRMGGAGYQLYRYKVVNVAAYERLEEHGPDTWRRAIYSQAARGIRDELLGVFDCPESAQRTPKRPSTTTALQALSLLNGPFTVQQSRFLAEGAAGLPVDQQAAHLYQRVLGRDPDGDERREGLELVRKHGPAALARVLLNSSEFLYY